MADRQATPDAVVTIRASEYQRTVSVGAFARSFDSPGESASNPNGIKAVWRNETGACPVPKADAL